MEIEFKTAKLAKVCNKESLLVRQFGAERAKRIRQRLEDLAAAPALMEFRRLPGRCHELRGDLEGVLSLDLDGPYRLLFRPAHDPLPRRPDGGLDWSLVTRVEIAEVKDTHE